MNIHEIIQTFGLVILKSDLLAEIIKKKPTWSTSLRKLIKVNSQDCIGFLNIKFSQAKY